MKGVKFCVEYYSNNRKRARSHTNRVLFARILNIDIFLREVQSAGGGVKVTILNYFTFSTKILGTEKS